ncbi:MAG: DNA repair protein RecO [Clostridia bacterium]|nr:DNA repair protein RecO [Clostridia bacterium]
MKRGYIAINGIIIKQIRYRETDAILTVLTEDRGVIRIFCRGGKKLNSSLISSTEPLTYGKFTVYQNKDAYNLESFKGKELFFALRNDFEKISLAYYLCEIAADTAPADESSADNLKLLLNTLFVLSEKQKSKTTVKAVFELKLCAILGFAPNLTCCDDCGKFETEYMFLSIENGILYCMNCKNDMADKIPIPVVQAMRHILYSSLNKAFNFTLGSENARILENKVEKYFLFHSGLVPKTLDYYKKIMGK